jgi:cobalamin biosynthesis Mg chelatase CobN
MIQEVEDNLQGEGGAKFLQETLGSERIGVNYQTLLESSYKELLLVCRCKTILNLQRKFPNIDFFRDKAEEFFNRLPKEKARDGEDVVMDSPEERLEKFLEYLVEKSKQLLVSNRRRGCEESEEDKESEESGHLTKRRKTDQGNESKNVASGASSSNDSEEVASEASSSNHGQKRERAEDEENKREDYYPQKRRRTGDDRTEGLPSSQGVVPGVGSALSDRDPSIQK